MKKLCLTVVLLHAGLAHAAFKCVDERGVTLFGDTPPAGCANVVMFEVAPGGTVLRKIDPTPSPEQLKARLEEQAKRKEAERSAAEQKRKDVALLSTYSNEQEIEFARDRNIEPIRSRIKGAQERLEAVEKRQKEIANEMEFYKAGKKGGRNESVKPPQMLLVDQERAEKERQTLNKSIADAHKEIESVRARYDTDRKRYLELKNGGDSAMRPAAERVAPR
jgi:hypothetical protein